jgi:hypothetical protein
MLCSLTGTEPRGAPLGEGGQPLGHSSRGQMGLTESELVRAASSQGRLPSSLTMRFIRASPDGPSSPRERHDSPG